MHQRVVQLLPSSWWAVLVSSLILLLVPCLSFWWAWLFSVARTTALHRSNRIFSQYPVAACTVVSTDLLHRSCSTSDYFNSDSTSGRGSVVATVVVDVIAASHMCVTALRVRLIGQSNLLSSCFHSHHTDEDYDALNTTLNSNNNTSKSTRRATPVTPVIASFDIRIFIRIALHFLHALEGLAE